MVRFLIILLFACPCWVRWQRRWCKPSTTLRGDLANPGRAAPIAGLGRILHRNGKDRVCSAPRRIGRSKTSEGFIDEMTAFAHQK
jgi:hypothetical protein